MCVKIETIADSLFVAFDREKVLCKERFIVALVILKKTFQKQTNFFIAKWND